MKIDFSVLPPKEQQPLSSEHVSYDCWRSLDGDPVMRFYREAGGYFLRFLGLADVRIRNDRTAVECTPVPGHDDEMITALYFNQVLPLLMASQGELVLHASAVAVGGSAIAFMAPTGRGKSTLAAALARVGCPFLTDDGLILKMRQGACWVEPRRPFLRLRPDSEAALLGLPGDLRLRDEEQPKRRVPARPDLPFLEQPVPLAAIYFLVEPSAPDRPLVVEIPPPAALAQMMQHSFILDVDDQVRVASLFGQLADIAERVPLASLDFRRSYDCLPAVVAALLDRHSIGAM